MARQIITPNSARAKIEMKQLAENYHGALDKVKQYDRICLTEIGFDWNSTTLSRGKGSSIEFMLGNEYVGSEYVSGRIHNGITPVPVIEAYDPKNLIGSSSMTPDYIINSINEAVKISKKLNIMENFEFLPGGEQDPGIKGNGGKGKPSIVDPRMKAFARELTEVCEELIVGRVNKVFGDYIVVKTKQGWYMAYNKDYGDAPYIVLDIQDLLQDKTFLIKTNGALKCRRDHRGPWPERLRKLL